MEKTVNTYLKLLNAVIKPVALYACEAWGDSLKKDCFQNEIEKPHTSTCKQILGLPKHVRNEITIKFGRYPFITNMEIQMFKCFQRFPFLSKESLLRATLQEEII